MYNNRKISLINAVTKEQHDFECLRDADTFLGRTFGYTMQRLRRAEKIYAATTFEVYEAYLAEDTSRRFGGRQPCETCKNFAVGCSWSERFEPVKGWEAVPTVISNQDHPCESYHIISCPKYERG